MPKSRVRKKAVYTPPPRSAKANVSPPWLVPVMLGCLIVGLAWIATFYVSGQKLPISAISQVALAPAAGPRPLVITET